MRLNKIKWWKTRQGNLRDPREWNRLLMQYGGVFKDNIKDYAETLPKLKRQKKNFSR